MNPATTTTTTATSKNSVPLAPLTPLMHPDTCNNDDDIVTTTPTPYTRKQKMASVCYVCIAFPFVSCFTALVPMNVISCMTISCCLALANGQIDAVSEECADLTIRIIDRF